MNIINNFKKITQDRENIDKKIETFFTHPKTMINLEKGSILGLNLQEISEMLSTTSYDEDMQGEMHKFNEFYKKFNKGEDIYKKMEDMKNELKTKEVQMLAEEVQMPSEEVQMPSEEVQMSSEEVQMSPEEVQMPIEDISLTDLEPEQSISGENILKEKSKGKIMQTLDGKYQLHHLLSIITAINRCRGQSR